MLEQIEGALADSARPPSPLGVRAQLAADADGYTAALEFTGGDSSTATRSLHDSSCATLAEACALVIAIAIDPGVAERRAKPAPPPPPKPEPKPEAQSLPPAPKSSVPIAIATPHDGKPARDQPPALLEVGAGLVLHSGMLPFFAEGAFGAVAMRVLGLRLQLSGFALPAQLTAAPQTPRVSTHLSLVGGAMHVGYELRFGALSLGPALGASLVSISGQARGVGARAQQGNDTSLMLDAGAAVAVQLVSGLALRLSGELGAPLSRRRYVVLGLEGVVHTPDVVTETLQLGLFVQTR